MNVIFCEECGGKNIISPEQLQQIKTSPPTCTICGNAMSQETIIDHGAHAATVDTSQYHLLFIDDDRLYQELLISILADEYTLSVASSGEQGLQLAETIVPDLILLDVNMPDMDGYSVCRQLKGNPRLRHIPVLFVTAMTDKGMESKGLVAGAVDYISKPFQKDVLHARIDLQLKIKQLLEQQKQQQEHLKKLLHQVTHAAETEQEQLKQERDNFYHILNNLKELITIQDTDRRIIWGNQTALDFFNIRLSELIGKSCHEVYQANSKICRQCPVGDTITSMFNEPVILERNNSPPLQQIHIPLLDSDGTLAGVAHVVTEMTAWLI